MARKTYLDEIVNYSNTIALKLSESQEVIGLIYNDPNIDIYSPAVESTLFEKYIFDYDYINETLQDERSIICIDTDFPRFTSSSIKDVDISILVAVHKGRMDLNPKGSPPIFKGVRGNRRDNLVREIDFILRGSNDFGIGQLELSSIKRVNIGNNRFTAKLMLYKSKEFARGQNKW